MRQVPPNIELWKKLIGLQPAPMQLNLRARSLNLGVGYAQISWYPLVSHLFVPEVGSLDLLKTDSLKNLMPLVRQNALVPAIAPDN